MTFCLQALENISHGEDSVAKSYSPDNEDMVDVDNEDMVDVDDTATYDGQFYEVFYLNHMLKSSNSFSFLLSFFMLNSVFIVHTISQILIIASK